MRMPRMKRGQSKRKSPQPPSQGKNANGTKTLAICECDELVPFFPVHILLFLFPQSANYVQAVLYWPVVGGNLRDGDRGDVYRFY